MNGGTVRPARAVALRYDGLGAPRVSAKGDNWLAEEILALATENGIPIHHDAALVGLLAQLELDQEIPEALWQAVAEILAFIAHLDDAAIQARRVRALSAGGATVERADRPGE